MSSLDAIEQAIERASSEAGDAREYAAALLRAGEALLELWITAHGGVPTRAEREGFRLLALHRQGASEDPSFNACRETCRELVYHYNLLELEPDHAEVARRREMMRFVAMHLLLFIGGKMREAALGDFCCSSKPLRRAG